LLNETNIAGKPTIEGILGCGNGIELILNEVDVAECQPMDQEHEREEKFEHLTDKLETLAFESLDYLS
jgi:hypothetical protein